MILDREWADVMGVDDAVSVRMRIEAFTRHRHTEPLVLAAATAPLDALAC